MNRLLMRYGFWAALAILAGTGCKKEPPAPADTTTQGEGGAKPSEPASSKPAATPTTRPSLSTTSAAGWEPTEKPKAPPLEPHPRVEMRIRQGNSDLGWIVLELDAEKAPITVANFLRYVDEGYYNGTIFHRVISDFMIQGGGYTAIGVKKTEGQHEPIQNESKNGLSNERGTISMARMTAPHTASSEFFINVVDNGYRLDPRPPTGWGYAVFGKVVEGMAVVDRIKDIETRVDPMDRRPEPEKSVPVDPPVIVSAQRVK